MSNRQKCFGAVAHRLYIIQKDEDKGANSPRCGVYHTGAELGCRASIKPWLDDILYQDGVTEAAGITGIKQIDEF